MLWGSHAFAVGQFVSFVAAGALEVFVPGVAVIADFLADTIRVELVPGRTLGAVALAVINMAVLLAPVPN